MTHPNQQKKLKQTKIWIITALIAAAIIIIGGMIYWRQMAQNKITQKEIQNETETLEKQLAKKTLNQFFTYLHDKKFEKALNLLELPAKPTADSQEPQDSWEGLGNFSPPEERSSKLKMLENYCQVVGTCFKTKILEVKKINGHEYELTVQFIEDNGNVFVLGPCCGASEEEMPPQKEFKYKVKKVNGGFKVTKAPLYKP